MRSYRYHGIDEDPKDFYTQKVLIGKFTTNPLLQRFENQTWDNVSQYISKHVHIHFSLKL